MSECERFYKWEDAFVARVLPPRLGDGLSLTECKRLVDKICKSYQIVCPRVVAASDDSSTAWYSRSTVSIHLPPWAQRTNVVIHEMAHAICHLDGRSGSSPHGPEYVRVWAELFSRMYLVPLDDILASARRNGIAVD